MTQQELNNKIKKATEDLSNLTDTLEQLQSKIEDFKTQLETEKAKVTGSNLDEAVTKNIANLEHQIKTYSDKVQTVQEAVKIQEQLVEQYKTIEPTAYTNKASDNITQYDKEKNAKLAAEHPERTVDGIYYENDEALAAAKAAQEKKIQEESKQASAEATANANKLAAAMKTINETLYGTDNQEILTQLQGTVGGAELSSVLGNAVSVRQRQHLLNFKTFEEDFKEPNSGKPPHNKDPFPVDLKIEEFETHQPRVKVHEIVTHNHGKAAAIMGIQQFDATEKRLVYRPS